MPGQYSKREKFLPVIAPFIHIFLFTICLSVKAYGADGNVLLPVNKIEHLFRYGTFNVIEVKGSEPGFGGAKEVLVQWDSGEAMRVKWKNADAGGTAPNNEPRYELAAYELQKLFLDEDMYVVPPTAIGCLSLKRSITIDTQSEPTFEGIDYVFYVMQYWLQKVKSENIYDKKLFESDLIYAKHLGNMNIFTYLIKHNDSNKGNILRSIDPLHPRIFSVDNGMAFGAEESVTGYRWRSILLDRLPEKTIDRLREIGEAQLKQKLGVVAQFEVLNGRPVPVNMSGNLDEDKGVRFSGTTIQFGLTAYEIIGIYERMKNLVWRVDRGKIKTF